MPKAKKMIVLNFADNSTLMKDKNGAYAIHKDLPRMAEDGSFLLEVSTAERFYWENVLKREDTLTVEKLDELYPRRDKGGNQDEQSA